MAALVKYADSDNTKDPDSEEDKPGKGKKNGNTKGQQHNRQVMGTMVSARQTIVWTLWLTPMLRIVVSVVRVNNPRRVEVQAPIWSAC